MPEILLLDPVATISEEEKILFFTGSILKGGPEDLVDLAATSLHLQETRFRIYQTRLELTPSLLAKRTAIKPTAKVTATDSASFSATQNHQQPTAKNEKVRPAEQLRFTRSCFTNAEKIVEGV